MKITKEKNYYFWDQNTLIKRNKIKILELWQDYLDEFYMSRSGCDTWCLWDYLDDFKDMIRHYFKLNSFLSIDGMDFYDFNYFKEAFCSSNINETGFPKTFKTRYYRQRFYRKEKIYWKDRAIEYERKAFQLDRLVLVIESIMIDKN